MDILVIGNIFNSISLQVNKFCDKDSEEDINTITKCDNGAAIVVSTIAAVLGAKPHLITKVSNVEKFDSILNKLQLLGVDISNVRVVDNANNFLLTIYDSDNDRKGYSYIPNSIGVNDLIDIDFSKYDAVFFCFLHSNIVNSIIKCNSSIKDTVSVVIPSGITKEYFTDKSLNTYPSYLFANEGEIKNIFKRSNSIEECIFQIDCGLTVLVVTRGKSGVVVKNENKISNCSVDKVDHIEHPGGAGDAFAAGFIIEMLKGSCLDSCCKQGHKCATMMLNTSDVESIIDEKLGENI